MAQALVRRLKFSREVKRRVLVGGIRGIHGFELSWEDARTLATMLSLAALDAHRAPEPTGADFESHFVAGPERTSTQVQCPRCGDRGGDPEHAGPCGVCWKEAP